MQTNHVMHKNGGRVTAVQAIGHRTDRRVGYWFIVVDVDWKDGGHSKGLEVAPDRLCYDSSRDEGRVELDPIFAKLADYLREQGAWHKAKWVGDRLVQWTPKKAEHRIAM